MSVILVVDDEPDLCFLLCRIFEGAGHTVMEAGNGAEALTSLRRSPPDLVVTDMTMPIMDGFELIRQIRGNPITKDIPVVAVSGHAGHASGADVMVAKPFESSSVLAAVTSLLERKVDRA